MAERPDVIFTAFGDMMRVPGTQGSPLEHKARGMRRPHRLFAARRAEAGAQANPDRHVMFFAIGFETTAPSTALTLMRAAAQGIAQLLRLLQPRHHHPRDPRDSRFARHAARRASSGRATSRRSSAAGPTSGSRSNEGKPIVVSGFEPLDILQSIVMLLRQLERGEAKVENQYARVVPWEGNRAALRGDGRGVRAAAVLRVARAGVHLAVGAALRDGYAAWDAERRFAVPGMRVTDPKAAQCGEVLKGVLKPAQCKLFGRECTPEQPGRRADGLVGRLVRRLLQLRASQDQRVDAVIGIARLRTPMATATSRDQASGLATRRSRWRTAPAARRAAGWSKG